MDEQLRLLGLKRAGTAGKKIGGYLYVHKVYLESCGDLKIEKFAGYLPADFTYDILKIGTNSVSFIQCPTFDELDEPMFNRASMSLAVAVVAAISDLRNIIPPIVIRICLKASHGSLDPQECFEKAPGLKKACGTGLGLGCW
ncbi:hypothetical protein HC752_23710 [Vibrio sp. S9_S30]|uniref:hypothetical protein n=1 Tax=Vibrio sp. S9_S30 TaxID=2720226 RepID=UPI00168155B1|nr:hypothetical protein [Vibrio sp. S9_S30]MBD1559934.1 hypothetical protein [Vibrio sp. S9_S30]